MIGRKILKLGLIKNFHYEKYYTLICHIIKLYELKERRVLNRKWFAYVIKLLTDG